MSDPDPQATAGDARTPLDQALDMFFYAPIGLALNAEEMVRQMAERGRQSVTAARFIGRIAMQQGRTGVDKAVDRLQDQAASLVEQLGHLGADRSRSGPPRAAEARADAGTDDESSPGPVPVFDPMVEAAIDDAGIEAHVKPAVDVSVVEVNRAIPDYDSLAASQVVPRLAGLTAAELETIRAYEAAHRGRTTVLNRISQLQRS